MYSAVFNSIIPIVLFLVFGATIKRVWIVSEEFWLYLNKIIYYFLFPCLMIYSISTADLEGTQASTFIPILVGVVLLVMFLIWLCRSFFKDIHFFVSFIQGAVRYNSYVFIGITLYYSGLEVMPIIALITAYLVITTNVASVLLLNIYSEKHKTVKGIIYDAIKNPLIVSCFLGLMINYAGIVLPVFANNFLREMGKASLPLSLFAVGASLRFDLHPHAIFGSIVCAFVKLIVLPIFNLIALVYMGLPKEIITVCLIYSGSPCTTNAYVMSRNMGGDYESMAFIISIQTILSMVTISLWLVFLNYYF